MVPVELETHFLNLTRANAEDNPIWELHHKYTEEFNMTDLSPNSIMKYAQRALTDADVGKQYRNIRFTDGPKGHDETACDYNCRKRWFCQISTADFDE